MSKYCLQKSKLNLLLGDDPGIVKLMKQLSKEFKQNPLHYELFE